MAMKAFKNSLVPLTEHLEEVCKHQTGILVDYVYQTYTTKYPSNSPECVGWLDGTHNARIRNDKLYEVGIGITDSVLDVGCGVGHLHGYLRSHGWKGEYFGIDPNKEAIEMIEEDINVKVGTIEDLDESKYKWVVASGVFNLGLSEESTFWIIHNMIQRADKGVVFNMLKAPYQNKQYEAYDPSWVKLKMSHYKPKKLEIIEDYFHDDAEFTVYFYK